MRKPLEKKQSKLKNIFIISIAVTLETIIITYPALCAIMGLGVKSAWSNTGFIVSLVGILSFGFLSGLFLGLGEGFAEGLVSGLAAGLIFGLASGLVVGFDEELDEGLAFGLVVGLILGLTFGLIFGLDEGFAEGLVSGLASGLVAGLAFGLGKGLVAGLGIGFYTGFGTFIGCSAGLIVWLLLRYAFRRIPEGFLSMIKGFFGSKQELKKYSFLRSLSSFLVGYVAIVLIFSLWFYAFYLEGAYFTEGKSNSPFFSVDNINYPQWWDFIYYSFITITTLGYGDITPLKAFPQLLVIIESTIGVMLPAIFIGIILHLAGKMGDAKN